MLLNQSGNTKVPSFAEDNKYNRKGVRFGTRIPPPSDKKRTPGPGGNMPIPSFAELNKRQVRVLWSWDSRACTSLRHHIALLLRHLPCRGWVFNTCCFAPCLCSTTTYQHRARA